MTYRSIKALKPKNMKNSIRFTPETKINASQEAKIKIVCPISGCEINNKIIGDKIKKGQTVMIVEAMKTMNHVPSTADGIVKEICVEDGQPVEYDQVLILVE